MLVADAAAILFNDALARENARLKRRIERLEAKITYLNERLGRQEARIATPERGVFYVIQLEPGQQRVKLGWARDPYRRIAEHRCVAPEAYFLSFWPCLRSDEGMTIRRLTRTGCRQVGREVFEVENMQTFSRQFARKRNRFKWPLPVDKSGGQSEHSGATPHAAV